MTSGLTSQSRWRRLQRDTDAVHRALDARLMACEPFCDRGRYGLFLRLQLQFFRDIAALYAAPALNAIIPGLAERSRLPLAEQDVRDLGLDLPAGEPPVFGGAVDPAAGLGWLYVAEGADLGSPFLLKEIAKLGLDEDFGARHMRGHPEGRGKHWHRFTDALDAAALAEEDEARVLAGAHAAFARVNALIEAVGLATPPVARP